MWIELLRVVRNLRASFWFLPTVMVVSATVAAILLFQLDVWARGQWGERYTTWFGLKEQGARDLLSSIASSMITVAGVTFSITIVTLSLASSQYTSRVLRNFLRDRGNQMVLGTFVAVYVYCLTLLSIINSGWHDEFAPPVAVMGGVVLAFCGIGFLIYFIHHVTHSIQATTIIKEATSETLETIEHLFPKGVGEATDESQCRLPEGLLGARPWQPLVARTSGYVQTIDAEHLLELAESKNVILRMQVGVGEFVVGGTPLAWVRGAELSDEDPEQWSSRVHRALVINSQRTIEDDPGFGVRQIVDAALKALSPGVNDTTTANICLDHLTVILADLVQISMPTACRSIDGHARLVIPSPSFSDLLGECYEQIRQNAGGNVRVLAHLLHSIQTIAPLTSTAERLAALEQQVALVAEVIQRTVPAPADRDRLLGECERASARLRTS